MNAKVFNGIDTIPALERDLHLAIGMFDGVHLGHQAVIESAVHSARRSGGLAGVLTFWPHPSALVHPERRTRMMMSPETKHEILGELGVELIIEQAFGEDFARITAEDFLPRLKLAMPRLTSIYVGENWRFGAGRKGDVQLLLESATRLGISVLSAPRIQFNGEAISSTRIRECLKAGEMSLANKLLGYSYFSTVESVPGRRLGRTIGFPTLNLPWEPELQPKYGVYAVQVSGEKQERLPGIANYGLRPTVEDARSPLLEVHVLGECPFVCGQSLHVEWISFVRAEKRFASLEELKAQIAEDCRKVRADFSLPSPS
jgi:riboflavin kinase / FMN adenylyltransferase